MPVDLTRDVGSDSLAHRLVFSMSRSRTILVAAPLLRGRAEPDAGLRRARRARVRPRAERRGISTAAPDELVDQLVGMPGADAGRDHGPLVRPPPGRSPGAGVVGDRRRSVDRVDHAVRHARRTVDRGRCGPARHVRPPRPPGRGGRAPLRADPGAHRRRRADPDGRPPRDRRPAAGERDGAGDGVVRARHGEERARHGRGRARGVDARVLLEHADRHAGCVRRARHPGRAAAGARGRRCPGVCRDDLLTIDGAPAPGPGDRVRRGRRRRPSTERRAVRPRRRALHRRRRWRSSAVSTFCARALGVDTGIDLDGIVLGSDAGGAPLALGARGADPAVGRARGRHAEGRGHVARGART